MLVSSCQEPAPQEPSCSRSLSCICEFAITFLCKTSFMELVWQHVQVTCMQYKLCVACLGILCHRTFYVYNMLTTTLPLYVFTAYYTQDVMHETPKACVIPSRIPIGCSTFKVRKRIQAFPHKKLMHVSEHGVWHVLVFSSCVAV